MQDPTAIMMNLVGKIKSVACGDAHTLIASESGYVFAMGDNTYGQLGMSPDLQKSSRQPVKVQ